MTPSQGSQIDPSSGITKKCKVCKQTVEVKIQKGVPVEAYLTDPFCSSTCARKFYGTDLPLAPGRPSKDAK